jgi:N-acetylmuramoyl-L-alanine amidase
MTDRTRRMPRRHARAAAVVFLLIYGACATATAAIVVDGVRVHEAPDATRVVFDVSGRVTYTLSQLSDPLRLVVDIPRATSGAGFGTADAALVGTSVKSIRATARGADLRIVLEIGRPFQPKGFTLDPVAPYGNRLVIDLFGTTPPKPRGPPVTAPGQLRDVVVAVDAGHGGEDPGAIGPSGIEEKAVVLTIAKELKRLLDAQRGFRAELIRTGDYYVPLRRRTELARELRADLFVSVHADAFKNRDARGASVYTLSDRGATSETARWLAEKENATDLIGGVGDLRLDEKDDLLAHVLLDLSMDANRSASIEAGQSVLTSLDAVTGLHRGRVEQAGFVVLKSPDIPSMLVESGYVSNPSEARLLGQAAYQRKLASAIMNGVVAYLSRKPPPGTTLALAAANAATERVIWPSDAIARIADGCCPRIDGLTAGPSVADDMIRARQVLVIPAS